MLNRCLDGISFYLVELQSDSSRDECIVNSLREIQIKMERLERWKHPVMADDDDDNDDDNLGSLFITNVGDPVHSNDDVDLMMLNKHPIARFTADFCKVDGSVGFDQLFYCELIST